MNKIVKSVIIAISALAAAETVFAMGKGYALGVAKYAESNSDMNCEEFVDLIGGCKRPSAKFIAFTAKAIEYDLSKCVEKEES